MQRTFGKTKPFLEYKIGLFLNFAVGFLRKIEVNSIFLFLIAGFDFIAPV